MLRKFKHLGLLFLVQVHIKYFFAKLLKLQNTISEKSCGLTNNYKVSTHGISIQIGNRTSLVSGRLPVVLSG